MKGVYCNVGTAQRNTDACRTRARLTIATAQGDKFLFIENNRLSNYTDWMKHRVDSPKGEEIYSHRMSVVEPVFGNIGLVMKGLERDKLRLRAKVRLQQALAGRSSG